MLRGPTTSPFNTLQCSHLPPSPDHQHPSCSTPTPPYCHPTNPRHHQLSPSVPHCPYTLCRPPPSTPGHFPPKRQPHPPVHPQYTSPYPPPTPHPRPQFTPLYMGVPNITNGSSPLVGGGYAEPLLLNTLPPSPPDPASIVNGSFTVSADSNPYVVPLVTMVRCHAANRGLRRWVSVLLCTTGTCCSD